MCLFFALRKLYQDGGYLLIRKGKDSIFPHFLHMDKQCTKITHWTSHGIICRYLTRRKSKTIKEQL